MIFTFILVLSNKSNFSPLIFRLINMGIKEVICWAVNHWIHWSGVQSLISIGSLLSRERMEILNKNNDELLPVGSNDRTTEIRVFALNEGIDD